MKKNAAGRVADRGGKRGKIFLSHSGSEKAFAVMIAESLRAARLSPWIDSEEILVGDDILEKVGDGLERMDLLVLIVSHRALESAWVDRELKFATRREITDKEIRILPFIVDDTVVDDLPWSIRNHRAHRVVPDPSGAEDVVEQIRAVLNRRSPRSGSRRTKTFMGDPRVDRFIKHVHLADWNGAELSAIELTKATDAEGRNQIFEALLEYQDLKDNDPRLWGALHTIECCARVAPWLFNHRILARMANHSNFSVRSSAASICMDLAHSAPNQVPLDILLRLSKFDEDWYVEAPANAALKAMARSFPAVLRIFFERLRSSFPDERSQAVHAILDIANNEPQILNPEELEKAVSTLRSVGDNDVVDLLKDALAKAKSTPRYSFHRYGL